jgi:hypothetical protein
MGGQTGVCAGRTLKGRAVMIADWRVPFTVAIGLATIAGLNISGSSAFAPGNELAMRDAAVDQGCPIHRASACTPETLHGIPYVRPLGHQPTVVL